LDILEQDQGRKGIFPEKIFELGGGCSPLGRLLKGRVELSPKKVPLPLTQGEKPRGKLFGGGKDRKGKRRRQAGGGEAGSGHRLRGSGRSPRPVPAELGGWAPIR